MSQILDWFDNDASRRDRVLLVYSHGALAHPAFDTPRALSWDNLGRLRALGGVIGLSVGPPFYPGLDALKDAIEKASAVPFLGREGCEGIAVGTDFFGDEMTMPFLGTASNIVDWLTNAFDAETSAALIAGNARQLLKRAVGKLDRP
jgi:membrane dipeptidase